jgi:AMP-polyphosphate phosphotransferase
MIGNITMSHDKYEKELAELQRKLVLLQHAYARQGRRGMVVLEGWDAAGKGGLIRRISWALDPRTLKVWQTAAPNTLERQQHWMQRFWTKFPVSGELAIFDRSWYGRVLVERVEGFASKDEWRRAYTEINDLEQSLAHEGYRIVKLFLDISPATQLERFSDRYHDPAKRWKLTAEDIRNRAKWDEYDEANKEMLKETSTKWAPWVQIDANHKHEARIAGFEAIIAELGRDVDIEPPDVPDVVHAFFMNRGGKHGKHKSD